jgi:hypothetical protein
VFIARPTRSEVLLAEFSDPARISDEVTEKRGFDLQVLAKQVVDEARALLAEQRFLIDLWARIPACGFVCRDNFDAFLEDVSRAAGIHSPSPNPLLR